MVIRTRYGKGWLEGLSIGSETAKHRHLQTLEAKSESRGRTGERRASINIKLCATGDCDKNHQSTDNKKGPIKIGPLKNMVAIPRFELGTPSL